MSPSLEVRSTSSPLQPDLFAAVVGDLDPGMLPSICGRVELAARRRVVKEIGTPADRSAPSALDSCGRSEEDVEIAERAPRIPARLPPAEGGCGCQILDAGRDVDAELALLGDAAIAAALERLAITSPRPGRCAQMSRSGANPRPWPCAGGTDLRRRATLGAGPEQALQTTLVARSTSAVLQIASLPSTVTCPCSEGPSPPSRLAPVAPRRPVAERCRRRCSTSRHRQLGEARAAAVLEGGVAGRASADGTGRRIDLLELDLERSGRRCCSRDGLACASLRNAGLEVIGGLSI